MGTEDLKFSVSGSTVYAPVDINNGGAITITVENTGLSDLTELGIYVTTSTSMGDVARPGDKSPVEDYQDVLEWGEAALGDGLQLIGVPTNGAPFTAFVDRSNGASHQTKYEFIDLASGVSDSFDVQLNLPAATPSRFMYIDIVVE